MIEGGRVGAAPDALRIAHVNLALGYRGGERQTELLIRELEARGHVQVVFTRAGGEIPDRLADLSGVHCHEIGFPFLHRARRSRGFDILHCHEGRSVGFSLVGRAVSGARVVVTRRNSFRPSALGGRMMAMADGLVAISEGVREVLSRATGREDIRVVPSAHSALPVDPDEVQRLRARDAGRFVVLCAAAYSFSDKGQDHLVAAARLLASSHPDILVRTVGRGDDEQRLRELSGDLANFHVGPFVENLGDHLAAADAFVLPSLYEGLGSVLLDAMRAELPIIATRIPGPSDIVRDEANGLLVAPADPLELARAIARIRDDRGLWSALSSEGGRVASGYGPEVMATRYEQLYRDCLTGRPEA